jgi:predicted transposase/invertase (TIGR01784 family)
MPQPRTTLDPKLDVVFSMLFGNEGNRDLLLSLLNAVLQPANPIEAVEVLPQKPGRLDVDDKGIILDLRVRLQGGEQIDVEMQSQSRRAERERILYYWAVLYAGQLQRGDEYVALRRCVVIMIANFRMLADPRFHSRFQVRSRHSSELLSDQLELHVLELPKLLYGEVTDSGREELLWGRFLIAETDAELEQLAMEEPALKRAKEALETLSADPEAREIAERRAVGMRLYRADIAGAREEGEATGFVKGEATGFVKGEATGFVKGEATGLASAIETVLHGRGLSVNAATSERLRQQTDGAILRHWLKRALAVERVEQLFED